MTTKLPDPSCMRHALLQVCEQFEQDNDRVVLLTTFNFAPRFFESSVLPILADMPEEEERGTAEARYALNQALEKVHCVVACDRSVSPEPKGELRYGLLPVGLPKGRFHAKLMLMSGTLRSSGKPGLWLAVGSGNLTLSGWAMNREVVATTRVNTQHAAELALLLSWLQAQADQMPAAGGDGSEEGNTRQVLRKLQEALGDPATLAAPGMPTLHLALPFMTLPREPMIDLLAGNRQWDAATVVSPFWGGVGRLSDRLNAGSVRYVPSLDQGSYWFPLGSALGHGARSVAFGKFIGGEDRYTHAKAVLLQRGDDYVLGMGSANFTEAAMHPRAGALANVEAMLRYELAANPWKATIAPAADLPIAEPNNDDSEEKAPPIPPFDVRIACDWRAGKFVARLCVHDGAAVEGGRLKIVVGLEHWDVATGLEGQWQELEPKPFNSSAAVRTFFVQYEAKGQLHTFQGLVIQVGAADDELGYRPRPRLDSVIAMLRALDPSVGQGRGVHGVAAPGEGDGEDDAPEPQFDFFALFQATWKMLKYFGTPDPVFGERDPFSSTSVYGLQTLWRAIVLHPAASAEQKIARYIHVAEFEDVLRQLGRDRGAEARDLEDAARQERMALEGEIQQLLMDSQTFRAMFPQPTPDQARSYLEWFRGELRGRYGHAALADTTEANHA